MTHIQTSRQITQEEMLEAVNGEYTTVLASDPTVGKRLLAVLHIEGYGSSWVDYVVESGKHATNYAQSIGAAVRSFRGE